MGRGHVENRERLYGSNWRQEKDRKESIGNKNPRSNGCRMGKNTKFFHNSVIQNRSNSRIQKLRKMDGSRIETQGEIEAKLTHYFSEILNEDIHDRERDIAQITCLIPSIITREDNEMLVKSVTLQEVERSCQPDGSRKSPWSGWFYF